MDFSLTDEQKMFRDSVYRYGHDVIAPLCEEADLKGEFSFDIWRKLASFGILGSCDIIEPERMNFFSAFIPHPSSLIIVLV